MNGYTKTDHRMATNKLTNVALNVLRLQQHLPLKVQGQVLENCGRQHRRVQAGPVRQGRWAGGGLGGGLDGGLGGSLCRRARPHTLLRTRLRSGGQLAQVRGQLAQAPL